MTTYALNGLGRIGKLALRPLLEQGAKIAFINDAVGDPEMHAHLLEFDSVHGRWPATFSAEDNAITIDGTRIPVTSTKSITDLPLEGVDVVIDCTGAEQPRSALASIGTRPRVRPLSCVLCDDLLPPAKHALHHRAAARDAPAPAAVPAAEQEIAGGLRAHRRLMDGPRADERLFKNRDGLPHCW